MPTTKTVYVTVDGRNFDDPSKARDYEERLFEQWLKGSSDFSAFLAAQNSDVRPNVRAFIKTFFLWKEG